jgi:AraC family transcriptional regulator of adaptative response / DNA-3-methyladenine glycosylase II
VAGTGVPVAWAPFEIAVQSVPRDATLLAQLVQTTGTPVAGLDHGLTHAFPSPEALTTQYSVPGPVGETLRELAQQVAVGNIRLDGAEPLDDLIKSLTAIDGIPELAAHQIALRLGARDAFPVASIDADESWRPWRALAAMHLQAAVGAGGK